MKKEKTISVLFLVQSAMIAAIYVVLTIVFAPISFGQIQFRIAEALTILPAFTPAAIPGLFVGCLIGNILGGAILPDIIVGSMATLLGAIFTSEKPQQMARTTAADYCKYSSDSICSLLWISDFASNSIPDAYRGNW